MIVEALFVLVALVAVPAGLDVLTAPGPPPLIDVARRATPVAGIALAVSLLLPPGPWAVLAALPWVVTVGALGIAALVDRVRRGPSVDAAVIPEAALGFAAIGGLLLLDHRIGADPFGFSQFLVLLAAVHFTAAGFVMLTAITALERHRGGRPPLVAGGLAIVGGPLTAIGFFGLPLVNIAGALLTATAGLIVGVLHLGVARSLGRGAAAALLATAGACLLVTMPMAVTWAIGLLTGITILPLDLMTRVHGSLNAVGFSVSAMLGWRLVLRQGADA
ncbi:MAG TPA: YndJ family transporter [Candidatus Limnocylindrales bacterium]|jgi:hypothetical protein